MMVPRTITSRIVMPVAMTIVASATTMFWQPTAHAANTPPASTQVDSEEPPAAKPPASSDEAARPATGEEATRAAAAPSVPDDGGRAASNDGGAAALATETTLAAPTRRSSSRYAWGVGARGRWVSVPSWLLGLFTKHNHPLLTFGHFGVEAFRRAGNFDLAVSFSYQNMSPPDGNWLGKDHNPEIDTKFLQFRGLSLYSADVSFIWHSMLTSWFGVHAGAGIGVAVVRGDLFLFRSENCTATNLDDTSTCKPAMFMCTNGVCSPPANLPRTPNNDVLPLVPIVNLVFGVDFRLPNVKGWEAKLEAGFYDAFFAGFGVAYTF